MVPRLNRADPHIEPTDPELKALSQAARDTANARHTRAEARILTQAALAKQARVNRVTVAEIETSRKQDSVATLRALANLLDDITE